MNLRVVHNYIVGAYIAYWAFRGEILPQEAIEVSSYIQAIIGIILLLINLFYLFIETEGYNLFKNYDELLSSSNAGNYIKLFLLLFVIDLSPLSPFGTFLYLSISLSMLLFCIIIVIREMITSRLLAVICVHVFFAYFLMVWSIQSYVKTHGDEVIGSFWEKPNYRAKYMVRLHNEVDGKSYMLIAQINVMTEYYGDEGGYGSYRCVFLEKIFWGGGRILEFQDCILNESNYCTDEDGNSWRIELTQQKIN